MRILFLVPYAFDKAPSQRFRFEQYLPALTARGWRWRISPFLDEAAWDVLYKDGFMARKAFGILRGYVRRMADLFSINRYDAVFIHREASPFGPPWIEFLIAKVFRKPVIFDFDDAIWIPNASETNRQLTQRLKDFSNASKIIAWSSVVSCGNAFLADYAKRFNPSVVLNPTTIDTEGRHNLQATHDNGKFVIGWTGSHSTVQLLEMLLPVFKRLEAAHDFELHVICDVPPRFSLKSMKFIPWSKAAEVSELIRFNAGVMPLEDNEWAKGKCGFKALQYLSVGVPAVVSDVGVNGAIVEHGVNGYLCRSEDDWMNALEQLMNDRHLLLKMSNAARSKVLEKYSVRANTANFLRLFEIATNR